MKKYLIVFFLALGVSMFCDAGTAQTRTVLKSQKKGLERHQLNSLKTISAMIKRGDPTSKIQKEFENFIKNSKVKIKPAPYDNRPVVQRIKAAPDSAQLTRTEPKDINAIIQFVLREAYLESLQDLQAFSDKVKYFNELKKAVRDELSKIRKALAEHKRGRRIQKITIKHISLTNERIITRPGRVISTAKEFEDYIKKLEEQLSTIGDDAQLANIDLQNALQKQQQLIQMMSQMSKILHDTAMAAIRKIG